MAISPLKITPKLAPNPKKTPMYSVTVKDSGGKDVVCADPDMIRGLVALMNMHAAVGGAASHWGGPAAFAEISAAVHSIIFSIEESPWHEAYNFVNDAGHCENGIYAIRALYGFDALTFDELWKFRSIETKLTGHGESHLNPEGVLLSNGPLSSSLPQAQGLALADKLVGRDRLTVVLLSDGASMEGEAREAFASIPGYAEKGYLNPFVMVISDNDTKLSGRISKDSFRMQPTFEALDKLGWDMVRVEDGNDLQAVFLAIEDAFKRAKGNPARPVAVWCTTVKGKGVKSTEESDSGGHGFPLKTPEKIVEFVSEIFGGNPPDVLAAEAKKMYETWSEKEAKKSSGASGPKKLKAQDGLAFGMIKAAEEGLPVVSVCADLAGSTRTKLFREKYPERSFDLGVAEANMVSVGAGCAKAGLVPVVDTFAQFGITKGNLPLTMAALSQAPVIAVFSHVGFQDAADGASHQATTYLAATAAIPHTATVIISCAAQGEAYMYEAIKRQVKAREAGEDGESVIFFVGRESFPNRIDESLAYEWGKAVVHREGGDVVIVAAGSMIYKARQAAEQLSDKGIDAAVVENAFVNRVDMGTIRPMVEAADGRLITVENHQLLGGMGTMLAHALVNAGTVCRMESIGIRGIFGRSAYMADHLYKRFGMWPSKIAEAAEKLLK